jgi:4-amino-4-deoxy-L-arabinose transferase-like glycosyltransferase
MVRSSFLVMCVFCVLLQCTGIVDHSLWTPDEPREGEIVREMSLSGDYLIPHLAGSAFLEKPPLYYSVAVFFYSVLGSRFEEAGRMASAVFALATLAVASLTTRRIWSRREAFFAPLVLASFPVFYLASHKILVDMGLMFFITAAMCSFLVAHHEKNPYLYRMFWVSLAGAFLCKGVVGLAIPGVSLALFAIWQRDVDFVRDAWVIPGAVLVAGVIAAWAGLLYMRGGSGYLYTFFVYNQIGRFIPMGIIYEGGHVRPFHYYLEIIPAVTAPFSLLLIPAAARMKKPDPIHRFLYSWVLGGLLILSLASTKREIYFLPMLPAMALIIAQWAGNLEMRGARAWERWILTAILITILTVAVILPVVYVKMGGSEVAAMLISMVMLGFILVMWTRSGWSRFSAVLLGWVLMFILWTPAVLPQIDRQKSYKDMFEDMGRIASHKQAVGFQLTETVEALGPFYGHFPVTNIEDKARFVDALHRNAAEYVIVLPGRMGEDLGRELASHALQVYRGGGKTRREIELWKMRLSP